SLLPYRVIAHTHDVATMSLTNVPDGTAERMVRELFEGGITYVPYSRPGFPLARAVSAMVSRIPSDTIGLALAHHGLGVWGDDAEQTHRRLLQVVRQIDEYIATWRRGRLRGKAVAGPGTGGAPSARGRASRGAPHVGVSSGASPAGVSPGERRRLAELVL